MHIKVKQPENSHLVSFLVLSLILEQNQQERSRAPVIKEACQQTVCFHKAFVTKGENRDRVSPPLQNCICFQRQMEFR